MTRLVDLSGKEIKAGDLIAKATSCTGHGRLRRCWVSEIKTTDCSNRYNDSYLKTEIICKSLIIEEIWNKKLKQKELKFYTGHSTMEAWHGPDKEEIVFEALRHDDIMEIFTPREVKLIMKNNQWKTKLKL